MIITTTVVFSLTLKNTCGETFDVTSNSLQQPLTCSLGLLFFVYLFNIFNPCRQYMTYSQSNLFFLLLIIFMFNLMNYYMSKNKEYYCKNEKNNLLTFFLLILNSGLIYISKV
jgi:tellurite resistance protein TehA-like permease